MRICVQPAEEQSGSCEIEGEMCAATRWLGRQRGRGEEEKRIKEEMMTRCELSDDTE